jgi:hypothetical protein
VKRWPSATTTEEISLWRFSVGGVVCGSVVDRFREA